MSDFFSEESEQFKKELLKSEKYRLGIAKRLMKAGLPVEVPPLEYRENLADRERFRNEKDIIVWLGAAEHEKAVIEVKSREHAFKDAHHFGKICRSISRGDSDIFVDTAHGWAQKDPKPAFIFMVSQITEKVIVLPGKTEKCWGRTGKKDHKRNIRDTFLKASPDLFITPSEAIERMKKRYEELKPSRNEFGRTKLALRRANKVLNFIEEALLAEVDDTEKLEGIVEAMCRRSPE